MAGMLGIVEWFMTQLGFGQQLFIAGALVFMAFELFRAASAGRRVGGRVVNIWVYGVVVLVMFALAIALGWVSPNVGSFVSDVSTAGSVLIDWLLDIGARLVEGLAG